MSDDPQDPAPKKPWPKGGDLVPVQDIRGGSSVFIFKDEQEKKRAAAAARKRNAATDQKLRNQTAENKRLRNQIASLKREVAAATNPNNQSRGDAPTVVQTPAQSKSTGGGSANCGPSTTTTNVQNPTILRPGCEMSPTKIIILPPPTKP